MIWKSLVIVFETIVVNEHHLRTVYNFHRTLFRMIWGYGNHWGSDVIILLNMSTVFVQLRMDPSDANQLFFVDWYLRLAMDHLGSCTQVKEIRNRYMELLPCSFQHRRHVSSLLTPIGRFSEQNWECWAVTLDRNQNHRTASSRVGQATPEWRLSYKPFPNEKTLQSSGSPEVNMSSEILVEFGTLTL